MQNIKKPSSLLEDMDLKDELRVLEEEQAFRIGKMQYKYYDPNGKCEEYIRAVGSGNYFVVLFSAANGVGKSAASANIVANIVFENENPYFDAPLYNAWPFPKNGRIVTDTNNVSGVVDTLKEWLPVGRYKTRKGGKAFESLWETDNGWKWDVMTYQQEPKEFEGPTLGWIWFDEPPTQTIYKACVSRLRKGGIIFISATMLRGSAWLFDHIVEGRSDDPDMEQMAKGQRHYIEAPVEAACKEHGIRGHLEHENIQKMIAEYDEDERLARVEGKFQHMAGLVFKQFSRKIHVIKPFQISLRDFSVFELLDPHPRNPDAVMWVATDRKGTHFVIDELYIKCQNGDEELAERIKTKAKEYRIERRLCDPSAFIEDQHTGKSLASRLSGYGLNYLEASKSRTASNRRIGTALGYIQLPTGQFIKAPEVYFFDTCKRTIYELEHWRWDEWSGRTSENKNQKEKPIDKDDHMIENLGRCLIQEPPFVPAPFREARVPQSDGLDPYA